MTALRAVTFAAVAVLAVVLAGCGGSGSSSEPTSTTTTTTTTATANKRLTQAEWAAYESGGAQAKKTNQAAITHYKTCQKLIGGTYESSQIKACFGPPTDAVVAAGQQLLNFIQGVGQDVGGACATATANLHNNVKLYTSAVNHLNLTVNGGNIPKQSDVQAATRTLTAAQASEKQFETDCKPQ